MGTVKSLREFKKEQQIEAIKLMVRNAIERGKQETPENPFLFGVQFFDMVSKYSKKDWENLLHTKMNFLELREAKLRMEYYRDGFKKVCTQYAIDNGLQLPEF